MHALVLQVQEGQQERENLDLVDQEAALEDLQRLSTEIKCQRKTFSDKPFKFVGRTRSLIFYNQIFFKLGYAC